MGTELAKRESMVPGAVKDEFADIPGMSVRDNFEGMSNVRLPEIAIAHQAACFTMPDGTPVKEIVGFVVDTNLCNAYWEKVPGADETETRLPDCSSLDGVRSEPGSAKRQSDLCAGCPQNAWGSAVNDDGSHGRGRACKNMRRTHWYIEGNALPVRLTLTPSSLGAWESYVTALGNKGMPFRLVPCKATLQIKERGNQKWSEVTFEALSGACTREDAVSIAAFCTEFRPAMRGQSIEATEYVGKTVDTASTAEETVEVPDEPPAHEEFKGQF